MALTEIERKNLRKLRSTLRAQKEQQALHQSLHGRRNSYLLRERGLPEFRDESAWIEDWQRKIEQTEAQIARLLAS